MGLTGSYSSSATVEIDGVTFNHTDLMKSTDYIQAKASSGVISNKTAFPTKILSVAITHSGTARATTIMGSSDGTNWTQVTTGSGSITGDFSSHNYKYFKITRGSNAAYWTQIVITYAEAAVDNRTATTVSIDASGITNTNKFVNTAAGSLVATVKAGETSLGEASVTWSSGTETVAAINATTGAVTLVGEGTTILTASYAGDATYKPSSNTYELTVTNENPAAVEIWSEYFSGFDNDAVPSGGIYNYSCTNGTKTSGSTNGGTTKVSNDNLAGGTSPELMVGKKGSGDGALGGSFTAIIPLRTSTYCCSGDLTLRYKTNANGLNVKTTTDGLTVEGEASTGAGLSFTTAGTHKVTFKGVTASTENITIVFTATSTNNVRLDDIVLKGVQEAITAVATPVFSPTSGVVASGTEVSITSLTDGATIYYTTDGTTPNSSSTAYNPVSKPIITVATTIKAIGIKNGLADSDIATATYTVAAPCATPTFSPATGEVEKGTTVTISTATTDAKIYYTTNGSEPTTSSSLYTSPITVNSAMTIKAIASKDGFVNSAVATASYTVRDYVFLPFSWAGGTKAELSALTGVTENGLGDYAETNAPYRIKMDNVDDYIQIKTNSQPGKVSIGIKMVGGDTTSKIKIQESADGTNFTDVKELTVSGSQNTVLALSTGTNAFKETTRYIRIVKSVHGSNIGVGPIGIILPASEPTTPTVDDVAHTVTLVTTANMAGWRTFAPVKDDQSYTVDGTTKVYYASATADGKVTLTEIADGVPANTPVILHQTSGTTITLTETATSISAPGSNLLQVSTASQDLGTVYRLGYKSTYGVGFYTYTTNSAPAGIIYLSSVSTARDYLEFTFDDETTGVDDVRSKMSDGRSEYFNLAGQRVAQPTKGLYIVNGKKYVIK